MRRDFRKGGRLTDIRNALGKTFLYATFKKNDLKERKLK
jgi:hypothetical protein